MNEVNFMVLHHTGRGRLWEECSKTNDWSYLVDYYAAGDKVDYLIVPKRTGYSPAKFRSEIVEISNPGVEWSKAVSSKRLKEQLNLSSKTKNAWLEQCNILSLEAGYGKPNDTIGSWPIYQDGHKPNHPDVCHVEIASIRGAQLNSALDYAVEEIVNLWKDLEKPQIYTHSVLEPGGSRPRIRNGVAWDPPTPFLRKMVNTIDFFNAIGCSQVPTTLEERVRDLERRVNQLETW